MTPDKIIVTIIGLALCAFIVWFFWMKRSKGTRAAKAGGRQEVLVTVKGGYSPDTIVVEHGRPVRLT